MQYPILKEAKDALDQLSADPVAREHAERRELEHKLYDFGIAMIRKEERAEGRLEARREVLARLIALKFGTASPETTARIAAASEANLDLWTERILTADTLERLFA